MNPAVVSSLAHHLKDRELQIIHTWIHSVRSDLEIMSVRTISEPALVDHLPRLFDDLVDYLQGSGAKNCAKIVREEARKHGNHRWHQGYQLAELLREIAIIRRLIIHEGLSLFFRLRPNYSDHYDEARGLIDQFFENVIAGSVDQYVELLREIDKARVSSIGSIAHDLANFVNALDWVVESFALTADENDRARLLNVLRQNLDEVRSLVNQLTDHAILPGG